MFILCLTPNVFPQESSKDDSYLIIGIVKFIILVILLILYLSRKDKENEIKKKNTEITLHNRKVIIESGLYKLIENFLEKFKAPFPDKNIDLLLRQFKEKGIIMDQTSLRLLLENEPIKLKKYQDLRDKVIKADKYYLLKKAVMSHGTDLIKNNALAFSVIKELTESLIQIDQTDFHQLVFDEIRRQSFEQFKQNLLRYRPQSLEDYIEIYLKLYSNNEKIDHLQVLLENKGFDISDLQLSELIEKVKRRCLEISSIKNKIVSINKYVLIENFVKKYGLNITSPLVDNLIELLKKEGISIEITYMEKLLKNEYEHQKYLKFKKRILPNSQRNLDDYIKSLLDTYGENFKEYMLEFFSLLDEKHCNYGTDQIYQKIEEYKKAIELRHFKNNLLESSNSQNTTLINQIDTMSGYEFEGFLRELFTMMGYKVEQTQLSGDQGCDLIIEKFGEKIVVQAKRQNSSIGNRAVQEAVASIKYYMAQKAMVVTNNYFTQSAIDLATANEVDLIDRKKLTDLVEKYS